MFQGRVRDSIRATARLSVPTRPKVAESTILGILCVPILCGILVAGLWPFHSPRNNVSWLTDQNGVRVGRFGTLWSARTFGPNILPEGSAFSIEIWIQPHTIENSSTLLAFYQSDSVRRFSVHQDDSLELRYDLQDRQHLTESCRTHVDNFFHEEVPAFVTITSGPGGTAIYLDGVLINKSPALRLTGTALAGRLVLGTSPISSQSWSGQLKGLAIYGEDLRAAQVVKHYQAWTRRGRPAIDDSEHSTVLYLFDEHSGRIVRDSGSAGINLEIPEKYVIQHEKFLEPFWIEFDLTWSFWKSALVNVVGFIPFGFFFCAYLSSARRVKRPTLITVLLGASVSLTIEVLQSFLPTRDSGTTDLITNTLGTALGALLFRSMTTVVAETLDLIPWARIRLAWLAYHDEDKSNGKRW